jgi:hypothetical protein
MIRPFGTPLAILALFTGGCGGGVAGPTGSTSQSSTTPPPVDECKWGATEGCSLPNGDVGARGCEAGSDGYVWGTCAPAACTGATASCTTAGGTAGLAACDGSHAASACGVRRDCSPGDISTACDGATTVECSLFDGLWVFLYSACPYQPPNTPLVLAFHGEDVVFTHAAGQFDLAGREASIDTDWVSPATPWLAIDRNGNGAIDDGRELFGSMVNLPGGTRAHNGFEALALLDDDGDGRITRRDAGFSRLLLWRDADQDRRSAPGELESAESAGLVSIDLAYADEPRCSGADCEWERAHFVFRDARGVERQGDVVDVRFASR